MIKEYIQKFWLEIIYIPISIFFMFCLNALNKELIYHDLIQHPIELLAYEGNKPIWYFLFTALLVIIGVINIVCKIRNLRDYDLDLPDFIITSATIAIHIIIIILLFILIDNPILRTIISVMCIGGVIASSN